MIDLRSDTVTRPSLAMKQVMFDAEVGDDVMGEDPTVNALEQQVAELLGKEAAIFTCSATQANQIAVRCHTMPGDELLINATGHIGLYEAGAPAVISGVTVRQIPAPKGLLNVDILTDLPRPDDIHFSRTQLLCLENTTNIGGGHAYPLEQLQSIHTWAQQQSIKTHLDGARLFNATTTTGYSPAQAAECCDTVSICFSKGLGCPMGAVLAGDRATIHQARRVRKMLGGGLRQAGIVAAAAIYALENNINRLADDHHNAKLLARGLGEIEGIIIDPEIIESNLVFFELDPKNGTAKAFAEKLDQHGVKIGAMYGQQLRAVTHLDISPQDIPAVLSVVDKCISK